MSFAVSFAVSSENLSKICTISYCTSSGGTGIFIFPMSALFIFIGTALIKVRFLSSFLPLTLYIAYFKYLLSKTVVSGLSKASET